MPTPTKKLLPIPALRTARQSPARVVPLGGSRLQWYLCPPEGAFSHLVLLDGHGLFAHWVLPAVPSEAPAAVMLSGLWMQVPPATELAVPAVAQAIRRGTCRVVRTATPAPRALQTSQLLLHLPTDGVAELYTLTQVQPSGQGWLLRKLGGPDQPFTKLIT
jgi:hypothetical protein